LVGDCLDEGVEIHYAVNVTGHGWRKLMRARRPFCYVIDRLPAQPPIFGFLQSCGPVDDYEAFGNLNMGAGFALYVPDAEVDAVIRIAERNGLVAIRGGYIESASDRKVIIRPKGLEYAGDTLGVR
jgi:phosphoribosylformylglycinamidine cyclo-ligase